MSIHILDDNTQSLGHVLEFDTVLYYEGAMGWQSANFCTSTRDEHFDLIGKLRGDDINTFKESNAFGRMLIVSTPRVNTKLIAHAATLVDYDDWYAHYYGNKS